MSKNYKQQIAAKCYRKVFNHDPPPLFFSTGGTVSKELLDNIAQNFNIPKNVDKVELAKRIASQLGFPWRSGYSAENSPSGGGGTLTATFYEELHSNL
jgi:hypothetical protein